MRKLKLINTHYTALSLTIMQPRHVASASIRRSTGFTPINVQRASDIDVAQELKIPAEEAEAIVRSSPDFKRLSALGRLVLEWVDDEPAPVAAVDNDDDSFSKWSYKRLDKHLRDLGVDVPRNANKAKLVELAEAKG